MRHIRDLSKALVMPLALAFLATAPGCKDGKSSQQEASSGKTSSDGYSCPDSGPLSGTPWVPSVTGAGDSNHDDDGVQVFRDVYTASNVRVIGLDQSFSETPGTGTPVVEISGIDMSADLMASGSLSLTAEVTGWPADLASGTGVPVLLSLHDGVNELVNVQGCSSGFFSCSGSSCSSTPKGSCGPAAPTMFPGSSLAERRIPWVTAQNLRSGDTYSTLTLPTCDWSNGSPGCPFNSTFAVAGKLRTGTYRARYAIVGSYVNLAAYDYRAGIKVTVIRKRDGDGASSGSRGALDLNVVLVGTKNIADSRTSKGHENLDELLKHVQEHYGQTGVKVKLGRIDVYEWGCEAGGDQFANVDYFDLGEMFRRGSRMLATASDARAVNVFLVSSIRYSAGGAGLTILGVSGGIPGPPVNGTTGSGVVFSSFDRLATFNPSCNGTGCPASAQERAFLDMGSTISHELGHYLGLFHLSEGNDIAPAPATEPTHDPLPDTPACRTSQYDSTLGRSFLSHSSCRTDDSANVYSATGQSCLSACPSWDGSTSFCPSVVECEFNHVMWWTTKKYASSGGNGDGNLFSPDSGQLINHNPLVQ